MFTCMLNIVTISKGYKKWKAMKYDFYDCGITWTLSL